MLEEVIKVQTAGIIGRARAALEQASDTVPERRQSLDTATTAHQVWSKLQPPLHDSQPANVQFGPVHLRTV